MSLCGHRYTHRRRNQICIRVILMKKMTMPSFHFSSEIIVEATGNEETENKTGQYGKNPNFFVIYSTNISLIPCMCQTLQQTLIAKNINKMQSLSFYYFVCGGISMGTDTVFIVCLTLTHKHVQQLWSRGSSEWGILISTYQLVLLSAGNRKDVTEFNNGCGEKGILLNSP